MKIIYRTIIKSLFVGGLCVMSTAALKADQLNIPQLLDQKRLQVDKYKKAALEPPTIDGYIISQNGLSGPYRSGQTESLLLVRDTQFIFTGNLGFYIEQMALSLQPSKRGTHPKFDNPSSFVFIPLQGRISLSRENLNAVLNRALEYPKTGLRKLDAKFENDNLVMSGEMLRKGEWISFKMIGNVKLTSPRTADFIPHEVYVNNIRADEVMQEAKMTLDEFLSLKTPAMTLKNGVIHMRLDELFPPPDMELNITKLTIENNQMWFDLKKPKANIPGIPATGANGSSSYMQILGGDVQFINTLVLNSRVNIAPASGGQLTFHLYNYQKQLANSLMTVNEAGDLSVQMADPNQSPEQ